MKQINSLQLLDLLLSNTRALLLQANQLQQLPIAILSQQPAPKKWSAAQVLQHLNFYCKYYIEAIENNIHLHQTSAKEMFKPGFLGNYFTKMMLPTDQNTIAKKMKAPSSALPVQIPDATLELTTFINYQHQLINLLQLAVSKDMQQIKIPTSLSKFIKLSLGDTFRFFIAHQQRHFVQIDNAIKLYQLQLNKQLQQVV